MYVLVIRFSLLEVLCMWLYVLVLGGPTRAYRWAHPWAGRSTNQKTLEAVCSMIYIGGSGGPILFLIHMKV